MGVKSAGSGAAPVAALAVPTTDEFVQAVAAAQGEFARAIEGAELRRDPLRFVLVALSDTLGVLVKTTRRWEGAVGDVIAASRPLSQDERASLLREVVGAAKDGALDGANTGMRAEARRMIRTLDRGLAVRIGLWVGGAYVAGALTVLGVLLAGQFGPFSRQAESAAAWSELEQNNPDPRPALAAGEVRTDRASGRRYYAGVSLWLDPSRPPPAAPAKP